MNYQESEQSVASGQPVELYDIAMGTTHWRMNSSGGTYEYGGESYGPAVCKRTEIKQTGEIPKDRVDIELPRDHPIAALCVSGVPETEISVTNYRGHAGYYVTYWQGYGLSVSFNADGIPKLRCAPRSSDLPSVGGRRRIQRLCDHPLYRTRCGVDKDDYKVEGIIDAIDGLQITSSTFLAANWSSRIGVAYDDLTSLTGCTYDASTTSDSAQYGADRAFNDREGYPGWMSEKSIYPLDPQWISCQWSEAILINRVRIQACPSVEFYKWALRTCKVEASNNGTEWTKLAIDNYIANCSAFNVDEVEISLARNYYDWAEFDLDNDTEYAYYRLWCYYAWAKHNTPSDPMPQYCIGVGEIEMTDTLLEPGDIPELSRGLSAGGLFVAGSAERMIVSHVGNTITLDRTIPGLDVEDAFVAYAGCDHGPNTCRTKFGNIVNYGGLEFLSVANPYKSNIYY